jgi:hypothetical protein
MRVQRALWLVLCAALGVVSVQYAVYAMEAVRFPFGLDYSEGLIWQQALWLGTSKLYGKIADFPFLVCDYPPLYLLVLRGVHALGIGMLAGGRLISVVSALSTCLAIGVCVFRAGGGRWLAAIMAGLLPLSLLPVISWSVLLRVDTQALALTFGGIACAVMAFRRPVWLVPALVFFVASAFTKQIYLAGAAAMFPVCVIRARRPALLAYGGGFALGMALLGVCLWATDGRFLLHIVAYAADSIDPMVALRQTGLWLAAYPLDAGLTVTAVVVLWRARLSHHAMRQWADMVRAVRDDEHCAWLVFLSLYLVLTTAMLITAGKIGASRNYFLEWMCCWCLWLGTLAAYVVGRQMRLAYVMPALLLLQLWPVQIGMQGLRAGQFSAARRADWGALLARVRGIPGPLLSDDTVLTLQAGREVGLEPGILLELTRTGLWDERRLTDKLKAHYFGAVITAYDPGDPTFDARYLPATQRALLAAYPHVETFGDYRLRLP